MLPTVLLFSVLSTFALASSNANIKARQNLEFSASTGDNGTSISSDVPLPCLEGCIEPLTAYYTCFNASEAGLSAEDSKTACGQICVQNMYDNLVACLECNIANGADYTREVIQAKLSGTNEQCATNNATISLFQTLSLSATATGPFSTLVTATETQLPVWTGLASYVSAEGGAVTRTPGGFTTRASDIASSAASAASAASSQAAADASKIGESASYVLASASSAAASAAQTSNGAGPGHAVSFAGMGGLMAIAGWVLA